MKNRDRRSTSWLVGVMGGCGRNKIKLMAQQQKEQKNRTETEMKLSTRTDRRGAFFVAVLV